MLLLVGGWNNNPNVSQFRAAFRKLISRCGAVSDSCLTGNVTAQEEVLLIQTNSNANVDLFVENTHDAHSFSARIKGFSIVYIAGYLVRKVSKSISCVTCRQALVSQHPSTKYAHLYTLLEIKDNGGLVRPSDGVITIILTADMYLRSTNKPSYLGCVVHVFNTVGSSDVLDLRSHIDNTVYNITNHSTSLIRLILQVFYNLRQHHYAKAQTFALQGTSSRHTHTKAVIFSGQ